ncbi:hypothetical protein, partial [Klebsiella pneumoniae]|uniref:hypothetical protein n=1 Tax=Klebsiella pneumoniae TaxID=573 RepID=UPI0025A1AC42
RDLTNDEREKIIILVERQKQRDAGMMGDKKMDIREEGNRLEEEERERMRVERDIFGSSSESEREEEELNDEVEMGLVR